MTKQTIIIHHRQQQQPPSRNSSSYRSKSSKSNVALVTPERPKQQDEPHTLFPTSPWNGPKNCDKQHSKRSNHTQENKKSPTTENCETKSSNSKRRTPKYEEHLKSDAINEGLAKSTLIKGKLKINQYNRKEAYVVIEGSKNDIFIDGEINRNRALDGDEVVVYLFDQSNWRKKKLAIENDDDSFCDDMQEEIAICDGDTNTPDKIAAATINQEFLLQPIGKVMAILQGNRREITGHIRSCRDNFVVEKEDKNAIFVPLDRRFPKMVISVNDCPKDWIDNPTTYAKDIFVARFIKWNTNSQFPFAHMITHLGKAGDIDTETSAALVENGIGNLKGFSSEIMQELEAFKDWTIPTDEIKRRRDLRSTHRIFTIDPDNAKDLDDALSISKLPNDDGFEIGVHIADVSYFVTPGSQLDKEAERRTTSIYLVHKTIPMLPSILSEDLCSLNPGQDRLAFSVFVKMDSNGEIMEHDPIWFGRTIISSCARLSYDNTQTIIENKQESTTLSLPIFNGHSLQDIVNDISKLYTIFSKRREKRLSSGALQIKEEELSFTLDENKKPVSASLYTLKESHGMVEELMLLANFLVAKQLVQTLPSHALLRRHDEPIRRRVKEFINYCGNIPSISGSLRMNPSAKKLNDLLNSVELENPILAKLLHHLVRKSMQTAKYFCASDLQPSQWQHYALHLPYYTHFTSPIRRYADLIVHRILGYVVEGNKEKNELILMEREHLDRVIIHCNKRRVDSQRVQDQVSRLYLLAFISAQQQQPHSNDNKTYDAIIMSINNRTISAYIPVLGIENRIHMDTKELKEQIEWHKFVKNERKYIICWGSSLETGEKVLTEFSISQVIQVTINVKKSEYSQDFALSLASPVQNIVKTSVLKSKLVEGRSKIEEEKIGNLLSRCDDGYCHSGENQNSLADQATLVDRMDFSDETSKEEIVSHSLPVLYEHWQEHQKEKIVQTTG